MSTLAPPPPLADPELERCRERLRENILAALGLTRQCAGTEVLWFAIEEYLDAREAALEERFARRFGG